MLDLRHFYKSVYEDEKVRLNLNMLDVVKLRLAELEEVDKRTKRASKHQRGYIHGLCNKLDIDEDLLPMSTKEMLNIEASTIIEELKCCDDNDGYFKPSFLTNDDDYGDECLSNLVRGFEL